MSIEPIYIEGNDIDADWIKALPYSDSDGPEQYREKVMEQQKARGEGQGQGNSQQGDGGADVCVCPECDKEYPHEKGTPCNELECEDCEVALVGASADRAETAATMAGVNAQIKATDETEETDEKIGRRVRRDKVSIIARVKKEFDDLTRTIQELLGWAQYSDRASEVEQMETKAGQFVTIEGKPVFVGGAGQGGGTSGSGGGGSETPIKRDPFGHSPTFISGGSFDEQAEKTALMVAKREGGSTSLPGVTRPQMERFYKRRNAVSKAMNTRMQHGKSIKDTVDGAIQSGKTDVSMKGRWTILSTPDGTDALQFGEAISRNYIKTYFNMGDFSMNYDTGTKAQTAFAFKTLSGDTWWFQFTTNAFRDREHEIFSTKALEAYVDRHRTDEKKGEFWYRHIPGAKFGDVRWQAMTGRFLVQAGPFDDTEIGQAFKKFFLEHPDGHPEIAPNGWGTSHGYKYRATDRRDGIYDWLEINESTVLPLHIAANIWSPSPIMVRRNKMNEQEQQELDVIGGQTLVDLVKQAQDVSTKLEDTIDYKKLDPAVQISTLIEATDDEAVKALLTEALEGMKAKAKPEDDGDDDEDVKDGEEEEDEDEKPFPPKKKAVEIEIVSRDEIGEALKELSTIFTAQLEAASKRIETDIVEALKPLVADIKQLRMADDVKVAAKAELTPAASLSEFVKSAISDETKVKDGDPLLSSKPETTEGAHPGAEQGLPSMLGMWMSGADQKQ